jgi:hypothetical protein
MSSTLPSFVLGYHGCDKSVADAIFSGKTTHLNPSQNEYDWLGHGIYFWENSPERAMNYAKQQMSRTGRLNKIKEPCVLGAVIDLGNCLDLLDSRFSEIIRRGYQEMTDALKQAGRDIPKNHKLSESNDILLRKLDCAVINFVHSTRKRDNFERFDSVRAAFVEGPPIYEESGFFEKTHIQICVRDSGKVRGYFRPLPMTHQQVSS